MGALQAAGLFLVVIFALTVFICSASTCCPETAAYYGIDACADYCWSCVCGVNADSGNANEKMTLVTGKAVGATNNRTVDDAYDDGELE